MASSPVSSVAHVWSVNQQARGGQIEKLNAKPIDALPRKDKINLEKIRASLFTLCTECGEKIQPAEECRIDLDHLRCPKCGAAFIPAKTK
jgi:predicted RNA-binding Zn-ribbon protein involved in translation (DUF1610 family)